MNQQIIIAGKGGQGIQVMGYLLGYSLVKYQGKYVVQTEEYGASTRGGESYTELVVGSSEKDVLSFKVERANIAVFMFQQSWNSLRKKVQDTTAVIYDGSLVKPDRGRLFNLEATELARSELNSPLVANMIMLGAISAVSNIVTINELKSAINEILNRKWEELNLKALELGYNRVKELLTSSGGRLFVDQAHA